MDPDVSRWLTPAGASMAVLAVFVVPGLVAAATDAATNGTDRTLGGVVRPRELITPDLPPEPIETEGTTDRAVEITGYRSEGRTLTVYYTVDQSTDCSSRIRPPVTRERPDTVTVFLERRVSRAPDEVCAHLLLANSVEIRLDRPLADRAVQDGGFDGALVPPEAAEAADAEAVVPTPPIGHAGR